MNYSKLRPQSARPREDCCWAHYNPGERQQLGPGVEFHLAKGNTYITVHVLPRYAVHFVVDVEGFHRLLKGWPILASKLEITRTNFPYW